MALTQKRRIIVLWGFHRVGPHRAGLEPSSIDKGVPELMGLGHEVISIYPKHWEMSIMRGLPLRASRRLAYLTSLLKLFRVLKSDDAIYTTDLLWCRWIAHLKKLGLVRNRLVFKWAGFDVDLPSHSSNQRWHGNRKFGLLTQYCDAIIVVSESQMDLLRRVFPRCAEKFSFAPTGVDIDYYRQFVGAGHDLDRFVVAVGSDKRRDWPTVIELAKQGVPILMLTEDAKAKALFLEAKSANPELDLQLKFQAGFEQSGVVMATARAIILATLPNQRFSGSTSVGVAAALGKPLILDEQTDLGGYGLIPGVNCEVFQRGDAVSAAAAVFRAIGRDERRIELGQNIQTLSDQLSTLRFSMEVSRVSE